MELSEDFQASCGALSVEQSCVLINSSLSSAIEFKYQSYECDKCDLLESEHIPPYGSGKVIIDLASYHTVWAIQNETNTTICQNQDDYFSEKSIYNIHINESGCYSQTIYYAGSPYIPILVALLIYFMLGCVWFGVCYIYKSKRLERWVRNFFHSVDENELYTGQSTSTLGISSGSVDSVGASDSRDHNKPTSTLGTSGISANPVETRNTSDHNKPRLRSLDTVRGIAVVMMIFVNYGGGKYMIFVHSPWNGLTFADLVFPWFIWIMGVSICLAIQSYLRKNKPRASLFYRILRRSIVLFILGIMLNTYCTSVRLEELRISGVLQRFGVSYFVVATVHLIHSKAGITADTPVSTVREYLFHFMEWPFISIVLILHCLLTFLLHAPGCPWGYLGPGGIHDGGKFSLCTGGAAGYIDRKVLGIGHLYAAKRIKEIYHNTLPHDPEGILGYLTSIFLTFLGLQAGKIIALHSAPKDRIKRWIGWFMGLGIAALILCKASKNDGWIPINKNLWSLSFVCATGSLAFLLMVVCYYTIDVKRYWSGAPLYYCGMNPILLYVGHEITHSMFPFRWEVASAHSSILALNLWGTTLWVFIAFVAYRCKFFLTV